MHQISDTVSKFSFIAGTLACLFTLGSFGCNRVDGKKFRESFDTLVAGQAEESVIALLGEPNDTVTTTFGAFHYWETDGNHYMVSFDNRKMKTKLQFKDKEDFEKARQVHREIQKRK